MAKSIDKPRPSKIDGPIDFDSKVRILDSSSLYEKNAEIVAYMRLPSTSAKPNPKTPKYGKRTKALDKTMIPWSPFTQCHIIRLVVEYICICIAPNLCRKKAIERLAHNAASGKGNSVFITPNSADPVNPKSTTPEIKTR